jgi:hypothetical protein
MLVVATLMLASARSARAQDPAPPAQDSTARAQESSTVQREGWIVGPLVGLPGLGSEAAYPLVTLGVGVTRLVPNHVGVDFAIGTAPYVIARGLVPVAARIGPSVPLEIGPDVFFIPSAGFSALGIASAENVGGLVGWYAGAAAVVARGPVGFRAGVTLHSPLFAAAPFWLAEVGVMSVPLPRLAH